MSDMKCSICGRYGIYWKGLGVSPWTYCPYCKNTNCQEPEEQEDEETLRPEDFDGEV